MKQSAAPGGDPHRTSYLSPVVDYHGLPHGQLSPFFRFWMRPLLNGGTLGGRTMTGRYRLNVIGPFYVEAGCCTLCGVPEGEAPDLFGSDDTQCFVKKQPETPAEADAMLNVLRCQELGCVRYTGSDPNVLEVIREWNDYQRPAVQWWSRVRAWFAAGRRD